MCDIRISYNITIHCPLLLCTAGKQSRYCSPEGDERNDSTGVVKGNSD